MNDLKIIGIEALSSVANKNVAKPQRKYLSNRGASTSQTAAPDQSP